MALDNAKVMGSMPAEPPVAQSSVPGSSLTLSFHFATSFNAHHRWNAAGFNVLPVQRHAERQSDVIFSLHNLHWERNQAEPAIFTTFWKEHAASLALTAMKMELD